MSEVLLIPICLPNPTALLKSIGAQISKAFATTVAVAPHRFDAEVAFDRSRGQYNSTELLAQILEETEGSQASVLGVAGVDLFIPILTYVFGEAQLLGRAAVVSTYRLDNSLYGLPANQRVLLDRLAKESIHELGHTRGLVHCNQSECVMRSSTYVEDIDLKSAQFCAQCNQVIRATATPSQG